MSFDTKKSIDEYGNICDEPVYNMEHGEAVYTCPRCGRDIDDGWGECFGCGYKIVRPAGKIRTLLY